MEQKTVLVAYFSGTGGTKRAAKQFERALTQKEYNIRMLSLDRPELRKYTKELPEYIEEASMLILLYPVYAFDAPQPVFDFIARLPKGNNLKTVVISVSGGGEIWPNTVCRKHTISTLSQKGFEVIYEAMLVMPANMLNMSNEHMNQRLLDILPNKVDGIVKDLIEEKRVRMGEVFASGLLLKVSRIEKKNGKQFSKRFEIAEQCNGCGLCEKQCPMENIKLIDQKPVFSEKCIICLRCVYHCPKKAIGSPKYKLVLNKKGFNLDKLEESMRGVSLESIDKCSKGLFWMGVKKYLKES